MNRDLMTFYTLARRTRAGVLDWLEKLPEEVFRHEHEAFAFGSLSAIYGHIASTYGGSAPSVLARQSRESERGT